MIPLSTTDKSFDPKSFIRYLVHIIHVLVGILLIVAVIIGTIVDTDLLVTLYITPIAVCTLIIDLPFILRRPPNERLSKKFGIFYNKLVARGYVYQLGGAVALGRRYRICEAVHIMCWIAWTIGLIMMLVAIVAKYCEYLDWLEEDEPAYIRLRENEDIYTRDPESAPLG